MNDLVTTVFLFVGVAAAWIALCILVGAALLIGLAVLVVHLVQQRRGRPGSGLEDLGTDGGAVTSGEAPHSTEPRGEAPQTTP